MQQTIDERKLNALEALMRVAQTHPTVVLRNVDRRHARGLGLLLLALASGTTGCGASIAEHVGHTWFTPPKGMPSFQVDANASLVEYDGNNSPETSDATELRDIIANQLRERLGRGVPGAEIQFARFRAKYRVTRQVWPLTWWILCVDLQPFGCPTGEASVESEIVLQVGSSLYRGQGRGSGYGGLYYGYFSGTPTALAEATEKAIEHLTYEGNVGSPAAPSTPPRTVQ